jgi:hypothetical protein
MCFVRLFISFSISWIFLSWSAIMLISHIFSFLSIFKLSNSSNEVIRYILSLILAYYCSVGISLFSERLFCLFLFLLLSSLLIAMLLMLLPYLSSSLSFRLGGGVVVRNYVINPILFSGGKFYSCSFFIYFSDCLSLTGEKYVDFSLSFSF